MSKLDRQFYEDKAMRDAAREVFMTDVNHAKTSFSGKGIAARITGRIGDGTKDVLSVAKMHGEDNSGIIAVLLGAIILWFARGPIAEILGLKDAGDSLETAGDTGAEPAIEPEDESHQTEPAPESSAHSQALHSASSNTAPPHSGDSDD